MPPDPMPPEEVVGGVKAAPQHPSPPPGGPALVAGWARRHTHASKQPTVPPHPPLPPRRSTLGSAGSSPPPGLRAHEPHPPQRHQSFPILQRTRFSSFSSVHSSGSNTASQQHEEEVRERRQSLEKLRFEMQRECFEKNEEKRSKVRQAGSDRSLTKLMAEDMERRQQIWLVVAACTQAVQRTACILREQRALDCLRHLLFPILLRHCHARRTRRRKQHLLDTRTPGLQKPEPLTLKSFEFFSKWPLYALQHLIDSAVPVCYEPGEFVCLEGDRGDWMYFIACGTLEVLVRHDDRRTKSRASGVTVATLSTKSHLYFGEYAVVCGEPRFASVRAVDNVDLWAMSAKVVSSQLQELSPMHLQELAEVAGRRRQANLKKLHPLRVTALQAASPILSIFPSEHLAPLVSLFSPLVLRQPTVVFHQGDPSDKVYYVATGEVRLKRDGSTASASIVHAGGVFGITEVLFMERRSHYAEATGPVDLWCLDKETLMQLLLSNPNLFMKAKQVAARDRTQDAIRCPGQFWMTDPILSRHLPLKFLKKAGSMLFPRVVGRADEVAKAGEEFPGVFFVASGSVKDIKTGQRYPVGSAVGAPELLTFQQRWPTTLTAEDRCDLWLLPQKTALRELALSAKQALARLVKENMQEMLRKEYKQPYQPPAVYQGLAQKAGEAPTVANPSHCTGSRASKAGWRALVRQNSASSLVSSPRSEAGSRRRRGGKNTPCRHSPSSPLDTSVRDDAGATGISIVAPSLSANQSTRLAHIDTEDRDQLVASLFSWPS